VTDAAPVIRDFESTLRRLAHDESPDPRLVYGLSGPASADVAVWAAIWPAIDPERRRWIALELLGTAQGSFEVDFEALFRRLLSDEDPATRAAAVDGLWEADDPRLIEPFVDLLTRDPDSAVRARAAAGLGTYVLLGELAKIGRDRVERAVTALVDAATDESEDLEVRRRATESAGYADRDDVRVLIEDAAEATEPELVAAALRAMGRSADDGWADAVLAQLESALAAVRFEAARAAGELSLEAAVPTLFVLAEEDEPEIQTEAVWALGEIGGRAARRALERLASGADDDLAEAIDDALATLALGESEVEWGALGPFDAGLDADDVEDERSE